MNILQISDLHFGTRHWDGNDEMLLDKINSYPADLVINTGDNTTDGLESEYQDAGLFLKGITGEIKRLKYDKSMMLIHHSILTVDAEPLQNSFHVTDFVREHKIEDVFCGHTHRLDLRKSIDLRYNSSFTQYMVGSLSTSNLMGNDNQFLYLENWGTSEMGIHFIRILFKDGIMSFTEELI